MSQLPNAPTPAERPYRFVVAAACALTLFIILGLGNMPAGQYIRPVTADLGVDRMSFSIMFSTRFVVSTIMGLLWVKIIALLGVRVMMGAGFAMMTLAYWIFSVADSLPVFYLGGAVQGVGITCCSNATVSFVIDGWFKRNKGTVLGFVFAASGLGGAASNVFVARQIAAEGWRASYRLTAFIMIAVGALVVLLVRDAGQGKAAKKHAAASSGSWEGLPLRQLMRQPYFWGIALFIFVLGVLCNPVYSLAQAHLIDLGLDRLFAAKVVGTLFIVLAAAKIGVGVIYDRFGLRAGVVLCMSCGIASMLLLATARTRMSAVLFAVLMGVEMPIETILVPMILLGLLGREAYSSLIGAAFAMISAGIALGNPLVNYIYDRCGSYAPALYGLCVVAAASLAMFFWCEAQAKKLRRKHFERE